MNNTTSPDHAEVTETLQAIQNAADAQDEAAANGSLTPPGFPVPAPAPKPVRKPLGYLVSTMRSYVMFCFHMDAMRDRSMNAAQIIQNNDGAQVIDGRDVSRKIMVTSAKEAVANMELAGV